MSKFKISFIVFLGCIFISFAVRGQSMDPDLDCSTAIEIAVNNGINCEQYAVGNFENAGVVPFALSCGRADVNIRKKNLFRFTAASDTQLFSVYDIYSPTEINYGDIIFSGAVFVDCNFTVAAKVCFAFYATLESGSTDPNTWQMVLSDLEVGQEYYIVLGGEATDSVNDQDNDLRFKVCLRAPEVSYVQIEASANMTDNLDWVEERFLISDCDIYSNVRFQSGDGQNDFNSIGHFTENNSTFLLDKGIALATTDLSINLSSSSASFYFQQNSPLWAGDADLNALQLQIPGQQQQQPMATSVFEFDFIALSDSLAVDYLFTSHRVQRRMQSLGIWLTDLTTQNKENIALIPGTNLPIHQELVIDNYPDLNLLSTIPFWNNPLIYWLDTSVVLPTKSTVLTVGRRYRLKFGINSLGDFFMSGFAMFIKDFEQQLKEVEVDFRNETALCSDDKWILKANSEQYGELKKELSWYRNGELLVGENSNTLEVTESGDYEVRILFPDISCEKSASISVLSNINNDIVAPKPIEICRNTLQKRTVDLTLVEGDMFLVHRDKYQVEYYKSRADALAQENEIVDSSDYDLELDNSVVTIYMRIEQLELGCVNIYEIPIVYLTGAVPEQRAAVTVCGAYVFPELEENQRYYLQAAGKGETYEVGAVLTDIGSYDVYVLQYTAHGCYEEVRYQVIVEAGVTADVFEDVLVHCDYYYLPELLSPDSGYYTEPKGKGLRLNAGEFISEREQTIYVYAVSQQNTCVDESQFTVTYEDCAVPKGISPNGDHINDSWDLSRHGVLDLVIYNRWGKEVFAYLNYTNQWMGQDKNGNRLPDGTYFYVMNTFLGKRDGWVQINK